MSEINRREFIKLASGLMASLGAAWAMPSVPSAVSAASVSGAPLPPAAGLGNRIVETSLDDFPLVNLVADALIDLSTGRAPVLWLHGLSCSGCSVSFLNSSFPDPASVITRSISLNYNSVVSAASGEVALHAIDQRISAGNYLLVVEGAVPTVIPEACKFGERNFTDVLLEAASGAEAVIALGTCASFGGIPAAPPNPLGAEAIYKFLSGKRISKPVINLPGCPSHPDWLIGTLVQLLKFGMPALTKNGTPQIFFSKTIHSSCPEFYAYNDGQYAASFGEKGCLFKLGCLGIRTYADCSSRRWNNKINWCVEAGGPCIGCTSPDFAQRTDFPFYRIRETS